MGSDLNSREDPDQAAKKQFDLSQHCLSLPFGRLPVFEILENLPQM